MFASRYNHIEMEIGPGKGMYVLGRAEQDPAWGFVAIEVRASHARLIRDRANGRGLSNLIVISGDARRVLPCLGPDGRLDRVSLHFPDPWWKKRHKKRAVLTDASLEHVVRLLRPGGDLFIQTDVFSRAVRILRMLTDRETLENTTADGGLLEASPARCVSNRERVCLEVGRPVFRMLFRKKDQ